jgi:hypothetical protein
MGRVCREVQEWVEEEVERPIEEFIGQWARTCEEQECNWWCLCCNKWFCWLAWVVVRVITWVIVTIGKWVTRVVCEIVNGILDAIGFIVELILSIPIIGGFIRMVLNWLTEILWRFLGFFDFLASLAGIRPRKKMYFGVIVPPVTPIASEADIMRQVNAVISVFDRTCNINMIFTGICRTNLPPPGGTLTIACNEVGFRDDFGFLGSYFEFASATCKFTDSFRRVIGLGSEIIIFMVQDVTHPVLNLSGCSFASTHNWVVVEGLSSDFEFLAAHEIGHACWLEHHGDPANLMNGSAIPAAPVLTDLQISLVRWSKHCVYL